MYCLEREVLLVFSQETKAYEFLQITRDQIGLGDPIKIGTTNINK